MAKGFLLGSITVIVLNVLYLFWVVLREIRRRT